MKSQSKQQMAQKFMDAVFQGALDEYRIRVSGRHRHPEPLTNEQQSGFYFALGKVSQELRTKSIDLLSVDALEAVNRVLDGQKCISAITASLQKQQDEIVGNGLFLEGSPELPQDMGTAPS